jgi:hypothetical protein
MAKSAEDESVEGMLDSRTGLIIRKRVYEPGLKRDENKSVKTLPGRDWNVDVYIKNISGNTN